MNKANSRQVNWIVILIAGLGELYPPVVAGSAAWAWTEPPENILQKISALNPHLSAETSRALPLRVHSLLQDEYQFFRGTADLFYAYGARSWPAWEGETVWLHGDVHLGNLGSYPARLDNPVEVAFGVVDLDEAVSGPFSLDLLRAMVALRFAAEVNHVSVAESQFVEWAAAMCQAYSRRLQAVEGADALAETELVQKLLRKARQEQATETIEDYCGSAGSPRFVPVRRKKGVVVEIMEPVSAEEREAISEGLWQAISRGQMLECPATMFSAEANAFHASVLDVVRWSKLGSAGSQGLSKYLVLLKLPGSGWSAIVQLKEEPAPAATRAGFLPAGKGPDRAREVAEAYQQLQRPCMGLVGYTTVNGRGYLIKPKTPYSKEPDVEEFNSPSALLAAAELLGSTVGRAHRNSLQNVPEGQQARQRIVDATQHLPELLVERSQRMQQYLSEQFRALTADPQAARLVRQAQSFIEGHSGKQKLSE